MEDRIDARVDTVTTASPYISGAALLQPGAKAGNSLITAQIVPDDATADFEVHLEAAVNSVDGGPVFVAIGSWDQDEGTLLTIFPVSFNCLYRFVHVSGEACRVRLVG